ncbi:MAG: pbpG [Paucimonas sp.]|nr:pbpG [Paucimonas sp.]
MLKSALGVLFSFLALAVITPVAHSADTSAQSARSAKQKAAAKKAKAGKPARAAKHHKRQKAQLAAAAPARGAARKGGYQRVAYSPAAQAAMHPTAGDLAGLHRTPDPLDLKSNVALVMDQNTGELLFEKNSSVALPIASITKLMTSLVVVESNQGMDEVLSVTEADVDREKFSHSRLRVGSQLVRADMLHIALMSSENRAASALGRHYPGGLQAFVAAMNAKARQLGMTSTRYVDSTGLSSGNVSSARDLAKLVVAAYQHPVIRQYSTNTRYTVEPGTGGTLHYKTSNYLVEHSDWEIGLQKTGYISEAGRCMVMQTRIEGRPLVMVFLDSKGKLSRVADAARVRKWLEGTRPLATSRVLARQG